MSPMSRSRAQASHGGMLKNKFATVVKNHFNQAKAKYTDLALTFQDKCATITGTITFKATYNGVSLSGAYDIEIALPSDYPDMPPAAKETGGVIPADFHKNDNGSLCLAAPIEVRKQFNKQPNLIGFIDHLVVPFLYSYSHKTKYNYLPYGELSHGEEGLAESYRALLESYKDRFNVFSDIEVLELLKVIAESNYRGHLSCPCGSFFKLRECHGKALLKIMRQQTNDYFIEEYFSLLFFLYPEVKDWPRKLISRRLIAGLKKL